MSERMVPYLYSDRFTREPNDPPSFVSGKPDQKHSYPNYSIHPYQDEAGRRKTYNTSKKKKAA